MNIPIKQILLEGNLNLKETRYLLEIEKSNFDKLEPKNCSREDWYFPEFRIRKYNCPQRNQFQWLKIFNTESGLINKKRIIIDEPDKKILNQADLYLFVESKRPVYKNKELYLERVTATNRNNTITFYSTEIENKEDYDITKLKLFGVTKIIKVKDNSLRNLSTRLLLKPDTYSGNPRNTKINGYNK